jgi:hypothetical protein
MQRGGRRGIVLARASIYAFRYEPGCGPLEILSEKLKNLILLSDTLETRLPIGLKHLPIDIVLLQHTHTHEFFKRVSQC